MFLQIEELTSGRININFESPFRCDNSVIVIVVQVHDVITLCMVQTEFTECYGHLKKEEEANLQKMFLLQRI